MEPPAPPPDGEATSPIADGGSAPAVAAVVSLSDVERSRRESVLAYCARLCDPDRIAEAVDAAFTELHEVLESADGHAALDLDRILLDATRSAAADRSDASAALPGFAGLSLRRSSACELMPRLLAARASELLGPSDLDRVDRHLARCAACRELERRRAEAERAYELLRAEPPPGTAEPFASPGDPAPEIAAAGPAETAVTDADPEATADDVAADEAAEPSAPPPAANSPSGPQHSPTADTAEHAVVAAPTGDVTAERAALAAGDPEVDAPAEDGDRAAEAAGPPTGEYAFELSDPEPIDEEREPATAVATAARGDRDREPRRRSAWTKWAAVVGPLAVAAIAIGVIGAVTEDESERPRPATPQRAAAPNAAPAPAPPEPRLSRAERRLEALGDRELGPGMSGSDVKTLQRLLGVPATGTYGPLTQYAVGEFQATRGIPVDGRAGTRTKRALARRARPPKNPPALPPGAAGGQPAPGGTTPAPEGQTPAPGAPPAGQAPAPEQPPPATGTQPAPGAQTPTP